MLIMQLAELAKKLFSAQGRPDEPEETRLGRALIEELERPRGMSDVRKCLDLIERGADLGMENGDDETAFLLSAWQGEIKILRAIAEKGVDPDQTDLYGNTALILGVETNSPEIVGFLVDDFVAGNGRRVDAEKKNYDGDTAYSIARRKGFHELAEKVAKRMSPEALAAAGKRAKAPANPPLF